MRLSLQNRTRPITTRSPEAAYKMSALTRENRAGARGLEKGDIFISYLDDEIEYRTDKQRCADSPQLRGR